MREPGWTVYLIGGECEECEDCRACRGPDETSPGEFAYTDGLHVLGLPELHVWARPSLGCDPGADWSFSTRDLHRIMNELAGDLVDGRLRVGDTRTHRYDGGLAVVTFRLDEPVGPEEVDAFRAHPDALVVPVRWSLERAPAGPSTPLEPAVALALRATVEAHHLSPSGVDLLPAAWRVDEVSLDVDQPYGPLTPLVRRHAALVLGCGVRGIARVTTELACGYSTGTSGGYVGSLAVAAARPVGRGPALERLRQDATDLADLVVGGEAPTPLWREVVRDAVRDLGGWWDGAETDLGHLFRQGLVAILSTTVVMDVAADELLRRGHGPLRWAMTPRGDVPDGWEAPASAVESVAALLHDLPPEHLAVLTVRHERTLGRPDSAYGEVMAHLEGRQVVEAATLLSLDAVLSPAVLEHVVGSDARLGLWRLLGAFVTACTLAETLGETSRDALCSPYDDVLPGLRVLLERAAAAPMHLDAYKRSS